MLVPLLIYTGIPFVALLVYFPLVFLNLTFTFDQLKPSNVPFYKGNTLDRYGFEWWWLTLEMLRFIPIVLPYILVALPTMQKNPKNSLLLSLFGAFNLIVCIIEFLRIIMVLFIYLWENLSVLDDCFDVTNACTGNNYIIGLNLWYAIGFFLWNAIGYYLFSKILIDFYISIENKFNKK